MQLTMEDLKEAIRRAEAAEKAKAAGEAQQPPEQTAANLSANPAPAPADPAVLREQWLQTPQGQLCLAFYQKFQEYKDYLHQHPEAAQFEGAPVSFPEHRIFEAARLLTEADGRRARRNKINLEKARRSSRCQ